jgi:hypothetical protein
VSAHSNTDCCMLRSAKARTRKKCQYMRLARMRAPEQRHDDLAHLCTHECQSSAFTDYDVSAASAPAPGRSRPPPATPQLQTSERAKNPKKRAWAAHLQDDHVATHALERLSHGNRGSAHAARGGGVSKKRKSLRPFPTLRCIGGGGKKRERQCERLNRGVGVCVFISENP